jgi:CYTH domain-containing protein
VSRQSAADPGTVEQPGKYARFELERRFLVERLPESVVVDGGSRITDRYIKGTQLRLRRMEPIHEGETILKLGQKHVPSPPDFGQMTITNIYLSPSEYAVLAVLEAFELRKRRYPVERAGGVFSVDVFEGHLAGLVLAEISFDTREEMDQPLDLPPWVVREVGDDVRFTGGALAELTPGQAAGLLREIGVLAP